MKHLLAFVLINLMFCSVSSQMNNSKLRVQYLVEFRIDTANVYSEERDVCDLLIGDNSSIFRSHQKEIVDSLDRISISNYKENIEGALVISASGQRVNFRPEVFKSGNDLFLYIPFYIERICSSGKRVLTGA